MVNTIQFGRGERGEGGGEGGGGGNKVSRVQVHKSYVKVKSNDDKCYFIIFLM